MGKVFYESKNVLATVGLLSLSSAMKIVVSFRSSDNTILSPFFEHFSQI